MIGLLLFYADTGALASKNSKTSEVRSSLDNVSFFGGINHQFSTNNNSGKAGELFGIPAIKKRYDDVNTPRLMLGLSCNVDDKNSLFIQFNSEGKNMALNYLYFKNRITDNLAINFGQMSTLSSMENDTGNRSLFNEKTRSNIGNVPERKKLKKKFATMFTTNGTGVGLAYSTERLSLGGGLYGNSFGDNDDDINKLILNFRGYTNPYLDGNNAVHMGINCFYEDRKMYFDRSSPADNISTVPIFKTKKIGLEFALNYGIFNVQSEYHFLFAKVGNFYDESSKVWTKRLDNFYVQLNVSLTGETLGYDRGTFSFSNTRNPLTNNGFGAVALAVRFSENNLNDYGVRKLFDYGRHREIAVALNWIPVKNLRFTVQFSNFRENFDLEEAQELNGWKNINYYNVFSLKSGFSF
jgi:phosphate-selective porin